MSKGISNYERQYMDALINIYKNGYSDGVNERTKKETKRLPGVVLQFDVEKDGLPILKSKFVAGKTALREILWIWQAQSNNIHDLKAHIWDEWADENGSIGFSYGAQIAQPVCIYTDPIHKTPESFRSYKNQAEYILEYLREFPNGRWGVSTIWNRSELSAMNLVPCCHTTTWNLDGGRLNLLIDQRSGDMPYGVPFNTTQYAELMILFARDLGVKPGLLTHVIADAHIYDTQMDGVEQQMTQYNVLTTYEEAEREKDPEKLEEFDKAAEEASKIITRRTGKVVNKAEVRERAFLAYDTSPVLTLGDNPCGFFELNGDDIWIDNYNSMGPVDFGEVAK